MRLDESLSQQYPIYRSHNNPNTDTSISIRIQNKILQYNMDYQPELAHLINLNVLTSTSRSKLESIYLQPIGPRTNSSQQLNIPSIHPKIFRLQKRMLKIFGTPVQARPIPGHILSVRQILIDFDKTFNKVDDSQFQRDIQSMNGIMSVELTVGGDRLTINILYDNFNHNEGYIATILHAIQTFCLLFAYDYDGLVINISLDHNERTVERPNQINSVPESLAYFKKHSKAFNVSGLTNRLKKTIIVTKREEIIKLLFHELVHYCRIDGALNGISSNYGWSMVNPNLNLSEGFTEFMAVILTSAYESIQLAQLQKVDNQKLFAIILATEAQYSVYLSATLLKFFGYEQNNWFDFFRGNGIVVPETIAIWEYIVLRAQLIVEINRVASILTEDFRIDDDPHELISLMEPQNNLLQQIQIYMQSNNYNDNIAYLLADVDWQKI